MHQPSDHGYHRLRIGRHSEPGRIYLVTTVVRHRAPVFQDWTAARTCARILHDVPGDIPVTSVAWVVMPDHVHWLLRLDAGSLEQTMCHFKSRSSRRINEMLGRSGSLWQDGFHDRAVRREDDVRALARYVVANPLRAGLCAQIGHYPFWDAVWLDGESPACEPLDP